jgi:hypothetical protein
LIACVLLLVATGSHATENDFQLWPVGKIHHAINEDWSISFTARGRFDEDASHSKDYLLRPYVSWTLVDNVPFVDSLTVMAGYATSTRSTGATSTARGRGLRVPVREAANQPE